MAEDKQQTTSYGAAIRGAVGASRVFGKGAVKDLCRWPVVAFADNQEPCIDFATCQARPFLQHD
jgi:hypothetical protein